jgi:hydroxyacylglutathione hydrolase
MRVSRYNLGPLDNNCYLLLDDASRNAAIVDPTFDSRPILEEIVSAGWSLQYVLNTHAHIDHVIENAFYKRETGAKLALHPDDLPLLSALEQQADWLGISPPEAATPDILLAHALELTLGFSTLEVVHTPGHSPGHVCFICDDFAIVGDVLFQGGIGRTDLPGSDLQQLISSIERELLSLPDTTIVYPGHGATTTIGEERSSNPFLLEFGTHIRREFDV